MTGRALKIGLIQSRTPASAEAGFSHIAPLIRQAAGEGAQLIVTPEGSNLLEIRRERREATLRTEGEDPAVAGFQALARELAVPLVIGSVIVRDDASQADAPGGEARGVNRTLIIDASGAVAARYDKIHVFDVDLPTGERHRESAVIRPGRHGVVRAIETQAGPVMTGLSICYDVRFAYLYRMLARAGAEIITVPAAFTVPTGRAHWEVMLRARAIETGAFIIAPAQGGQHEDGRATFGHSMIVDPWGSVIARLDHDAPGVLLAQIDLGAVARARAAIPQLEHTREVALLS
ncbi:MAG: carbon-nitrogen hydrolase family protein [Brevundimonas sp.]|jgi:deaminated glutathione amidase|uniref:carbon-nitrogen hydrolase family protein n=1 Tax=Brevundimonas sp. TaxID=1871086 RepID=UPI00391CA9D3